LDGKECVCFVEEIVEGNLQVLDEWLKIWFFEVVDVWLELVYRFELVELVEGDELDVLIDEVESGAWLIFGVKL